MSLPCLKVCQRGNSQDFLFGVDSTAGPTVSKPIKIYVSLVEFINFLVKGSRKLLLHAEKNILTNFIVRQYGVRVKQQDPKAMAEYKKNTWTENYFF